MRAVTSLPADSRSFEPFPPLVAAQAALECVVPAAPSSHRSLSFRAATSAQRDGCEADRVRVPSFQLPVLPVPCAEWGKRSTYGAGRGGEVLERRPGQASMTEEGAILSKAIAGDTAAFRALYARHRSDVARLVFRMLGARGDLDDVVQEVFFQVFRSLKDFRGQSKFSTWLHRVTVNVVLMHRRAARSRPVFAEEVSYDVTADHELSPPDEDADRRERVRAFGRLIDRLAEKKRTVFILHELEGIPPTDIATIVGAPVLTVRTRLFYARRELEAMLTDEPALASVRATFGKASKGDEP
jgi:RNA polymerase sigma factor (sigma-70 family)